MVTFQVRTTQRCEFLNIDREVNDALDELSIENGIALIFCPHTTAGITINENADPNVCHDLLEDLNHLAPPNKSYYRHAEGNSDSHLKSSLIGTSEQIILRNGRPVFGTWQSLYFCEFDGPRTRQVHVAVVAEE